MANTNKSVKGKHFMPALIRFYAGGPLHDIIEFNASHLNGIKHQPNFFSVDSSIHFRHFIKMNECIELFFLRAFIDQTYSCLVDISFLFSSYFLLKTLKNGIGNIFKSFHFKQCFFFIVVNDSVRADEQVYKIKKPELIVAVGIHAIIISYNIREIINLEKALIYQEKI